MEPAPSFFKNPKNLCFCCTTSQNRSRRADNDSGIHCFTGIHQTSNVMPSSQETWELFGEWLDTAWCDNKTQLYQAIALGARSMTRDTDP